MNGQDMFLWGHSFSQYSPSRKSFQILFKYNAACLVVKILPKFLLATDQMIYIETISRCHEGKFWGAYKNVENLTVRVSLFKYLYYNYTDKKQVTIAGCFRLAPFWVPSTSVHSAKWSSTRHTAQNVSQSKKKLQENHDDGKAKTHLQPFIQNSVQWYNQRSSSCL